MVGTLGHEVFQVDFNGAQKKVSDGKALIHGHYAPLLQDNNEVWGLTAMKNKNQYITCSDDATMRVWDAETHKQVHCVNLALDGKGKALPKDPKTKENSHAV